MHTYINILYIACVLAFIKLFFTTKKLSIFNLLAFPHLLSFSQMIYVMQSQLKRYIGYFIMERNAIPYKE